MRVPNDIRLLESDAEIDLILGGHDHHYETREHNGRLFAKSETDFREMTEITVHFDTNNNNKMTHQRHEVTKDLAEDPEIKAECDKYMGEYQIHGTLFLLSSKELKMYAQISNRHFQSNVFPKIKTTNNGRRYDPTLEK